MNFEELEHEVAVSLETYKSLDWPSFPRGEGPQAYYKLLQQLAIREEKPGVILEIGAYQGTAAAVVLSEKDKHGHVHVALDLNDITFKDERLHVVVGDSTTPKVYAKVKELADKFGGIFLVFHDSSHHYYPSKVEWEMYNNLLRPGGLWLCDDITPAFRIPEEPAGMVEFFYELPGRKRLYFGLHEGGCIGAVMK